LAGGFAVEGLLNRTEAGDLLPVTGDDDFLSVFGKIKEFGEFVFGFEGAYFFHG
jgi:hypothetical protein